jgi:DNA invertase Pin-like site-specific DNA recombinase
MIYGYARQTVYDNNCRIQSAALRNSFCNPIFIESENAIVAGALPELERLLAGITRDDVLVVQNLKTLTCSATNLRSIAIRLKAAGAGFRSIENPEYDTTRFDRVLDSLAGISTFDGPVEMEVATIPEASTASMLASIASTSPDPSAQIQIGLEMVRDGHSVRVAAHRIGVHRATLYRAMKRG